MLSFLFLGAGIIAGLATNRNVVCLQEEEALTGTARAINEARVGMAAKTGEDNDEGDKKEK